MRERRRYIASIPPEAWKNGRPPRERVRKAAALDDLACGLDRYLSRKYRDGDLPNPVSWVTWASRLQSARRYVGPAPDGSEWSITTRIDYGW